MMKLLNYLKGDKLKDYLIICQNYKNRLVNIDIKSF